MNFPNTADRGKSLHCVLYNLLFIFFEHDQDRGRQVCKVHFGPYNLIVGQAKLQNLKKVVNHSSLTYSTYKKERIFIFYFMKKKIGLVSGH